MSNPRIRLFYAAGLVRIATTLINLGSLCTKLATWLYTRGKQLGEYAISLLERVS